MSRILTVRKAYQGYVTVSVLRLAGDDGAEHQREVVSFGDSVCLLPYDPLRKVALVVRLPRAPLLLEGVGAPLIEAPAGMIEAGEAPETTGRREAMEEVGLAVGTLEPVAVCWPSPGVLAERSHLFLAPYGQAGRRGQGGGVAQEHEAIAVEELPLGELGRLADAGGLQDMKTFALVLALKVRRPELF
jgi:nudix-type nucleoside diphosphatase (YffH/AdpP family)